MAEGKGKSSRDSEAARKASRLTAIKREAESGSVKAYAGEKKSEARTMEKKPTDAVNAAEIAKKAAEAKKNEASAADKAKAKADAEAKKAAEEKARQAGAEAAKKKKLSAADIMMGKR